MFLPLFEWLCYVLRPFTPATACQISPNHQPLELLIYGYNLKHTMRETKGLGEDIHFRLGLSGDTTEKKTRHRRDEKVSKRSHVEDHPCLRGACCHSKDSTWRQAY